MKNILKIFFVSYLLLLAPYHCLGSESSKITIVKNGGGTELLENSQVAITLAVMGDADFIELPVHLTSDDQIVIYQDTTLNRLSDVAKVFPERSREDGSHYLVDFTLQELRQLRIKKLFEDENSTYSSGIVSLQEALILIRTLNNHYQKRTGVVINLIRPELYRAENRDIESRLQEILAQLSYDPSNRLFIQSTDPDELQKIADWPADADGKKYSLIQKIELRVAGETDFFGKEKKEIAHSWLLTNSGRRILATYAEAVALPGELIQEGDPGVLEFIESLESFDLKTFIDNPLEVQESTNEDSFLDPFQQESSNTVAKMDIHGVYVDSLEQAKTVAVEKTASNTRTQRGEASELPAFFSNLGLTSPTANANSEQEAVEESDESEW